VVGALLHAKLAEWNVLVLPFGSRASAADGIGTGVIIEAVDGTGGSLTS
jgi:hypothetical protein